MPGLSEIEYSRDECIAAVRDYYSFLTKMYLTESDVIEPPGGGWPNINTDILQELDKTEEVISLLCYLPYIRSPSDDRDKAQGAPWCYFADWQSDIHDLILSRASGEELKIMSEGASFYEDVPPHVFGLTSGGRDNPVYLIDTKLGIVHWPECPGGIKDDPSREPVEDDPYDYAPENEAEWRADAPAWAIADFFEILKDQFRELKFLPISSRLVLDVYATYGPDSAGMINMVQDIYREHAWPDLQQYRKVECLEAVQKALEEHYPGKADRHDDD
jgi:hypothetical protein